MISVSVFWITRFVIDWAVWFWFSDKRQWRAYLPTCIFASWISYIVEAVMVHYPLWSYSGHKLMSLNVNGFGIYIVFVFLFIQRLPKQRKLGNLLKYWFIWTGIAISIELFHLLLGHITYHSWWNIGYSYLADWLLLLLFYKFHLFVTESRSSISQQGLTTTSWQTNQTGVKDVPLKEVKPQDSTL
ncbi:MAG: hypothetical protein K0R55_1830 [Sporomusa sp.]|nr:hypothetical protein [Sporomusa sp.]